LGTGDVIKTSPIALSRMIKIRGLSGNLIVGIFFVILFVSVEL
jgi:hypothetical protein